MQARVGVREQVERAGRNMIREQMPDQHRELFEALPLLVVGSMDSAGRLWASLLSGAAGLRALTLAEAVASQSSARRRATRCTSSSCSAAHSACSGSSWKHAAATAPTAASWRATLTRSASRSRKASATANSTSRRASRASMRACLAPPQPRAPKARTYPRERTSCSPAPTPSSSPLRRPPRRAEMMARASMSRIAAVARASCG